MNTSMEVQVLQVFERMLAQPPENRTDWLAAQDLAPEVRERVLRLLDAEPAAGGFMEETAVAPDAVPPEFPKVGERLGNYELLKPLEAGGMGVVYLGRRADDVYDQQVAIKLVRPVHLLAAAEFRRQLISRFEDERSILARMSHPNVARILDGGSTAGGIPYLVMEFVDGVSLTEYCKRNKLDVPARLKLFRKVCDGVQEAHRHLIVHRDLKPDNVLVGDNGEPRLLDFGIAKILEQEPLGPAGKPTTSLSAMTPAYASPEQVRQEALTTSSDVYSLGVMLYQLLAGVRPYELGGLRPSEAEDVVCETLPDPMRKMLDKAVLTDAERKQRRAQLTPDLERIVARAMHKEAARRYGSASELADDLQRYLDGQPVLAHPDSTAYRLRKFVRRHRVGVAAASLALLAILAASGVAVWQAQVARQAAVDTRQVNNFLMDVLKSSDPHNTGSEITMSQAVDEAAAKVGARFGSRPDLSSDIRFALGYSMVGRGKLDTAERELGLALRESKLAYGAEDLRTLKIREGIAQLRKEQDRVEEAEEIQRDVVASLEAQGLQDHPFYAVALSNLGNLLLFQSEYAAADEIYRRVRALPEPADPTVREPTDHAVLVGSLAYAAHGLGELERAESLYRESIAELETVYPNGGPELATMLSNLSVLMDEMARPDEAYEARKRSVEMSMKSFKSGHPSQIASLTDLSKRAMERGDAEYALSLAKEAAGVADEIYPEPEPVGIYAHLVHVDALVNSKDYLAAAELLGEVEVDVARLPPEMKNLRNMTAATRAELCHQYPDAPLAPSCASSSIGPADPR